MFSRNKYRLIRNALVIFSFLLISLLSFALLIHNHIITNIGDAQFHLKRIAELSEDFKHHDFLPAFAFNQFNGSAVMTVYPYLNLFPIILLSFIVKSKILVIYLMFAFNIFIGLLISFYASKNIAKNGYTSYLFSIIYMMSTIFIGYNFRIFDLGSSSAYIFAPLVIFGFLKIIINHKETHYLELAIGLTLMLFSHVPDTVIFIAFLMLWTFINVKYINLHILYDLFKSLCLSVLLAGIYLVPFIYFLIYNHKIVHFTNPVMPEGISLLAFIKTALSNDDVMGIGIFAVMAIILTPFFYKRLHLYGKQMYWLSLIIIIGCSSLIKWSIMPFFIVSIFEHFQFMYRFLLLPIFLLDYLFAYIITQYFTKKKTLFGVMITLAVFLQILGQGYYVHKFGNESNHVMKNVYLLNDPMKNSRQINSVINKRPNGTNNNGLVTRETTGSDYYPKASFHTLNYINNNNGYSKDKIIHFNHVNYNKYTFNTHERMKRLTLPILKYNNELIRVYCNHRLFPVHIGKNNLINIYNINAGYHELRIRYVQNIYLIIIKSTSSCLGIIWLIFSIYKDRERKKL